MLENTKEIKYLNRFINLCREVGVDPKKLLQSNSPLLPQLIKSWMLGKLDDVGMMRSIRNLSIFNPAIKEDDPQN